MKRTFFSFAFLSMALLCHAQRHFKNEFSAGYFAAGYFFDATAFKASNFNRGKNISLNYKRHLGKNFTLGVTYGRCFFQYVPTGITPPNFTITNRYQKTLIANLGFSYTKWGGLLSLSQGFDIISVESIQNTSTLLSTLVDG